MDDLLTRIWSESQMDNDKPVSDNRAVSAIPLTVSQHTGGVRCSFNPKSPEGAAKFIAATMNECPSLESKANEVLLITDFLCHPAQTVDSDSGEVKQFSRIVVFDEKGQAYDCGSMGVDKSLAVIEYTRGPAPWNPPVKVTVKSRRLASKRNWLTLEPDIASITQVLQPRK